MYVAIKLEQDECIIKQETCIDDSNTSSTDCTDNKNIQNESCDSHVKGKDDDLDDVTEQVSYTCYTTEETDLVLYVYSALLCDHSVIIIIVIY